MHPFRAAIVAALVASAGPLAHDAGQATADAARTIYVDGRLELVSCSTYDPATRRCEVGRATAYQTLRGGVAAATAGTVVVIREGVYKDPLAPRASGTASLPITFRNFGSETAAITGIDAPALQIIGREYITIEGLTVTDVTGWGRLQDSAHIVVQRMTFHNATASGTTGGLKLVRSRLNRISDNRFEDGADDLLLQDASNANLVIHNTFHIAHHSLLSIRCAEANVIRGNVFDNPRQKDLEIYDCEGVSDAPVRFDSTRRNVIEGNSFERTREADRPYVYNAIQHGGQYTLVRRNVFRGAMGGAVNYQEYPRESLFVHSNRLYHNTFYANRCFAIVGNRGDRREYFDNKAANNLLYQNRDCAGGSAQTAIADPSAVSLGINAVELADPGFVDERAGDLHLAPGSRLIDRAPALTRATTDGDGTSLPVDDVLYFYAGVAIPGERGDEIQLAGTTDRARVVRIDARSHTLNLDRPLTWHVGQGVALAFNGTAPDFGAFEAGAPLSSAFAAPLSPQALITAVGSRIPFAAR